MLNTIVFANFLYFKTEGFNINTFDKKPAENTQENC